MRRPLRAILVTAALAVGLAPTGASADPDELMPCKILLVKAAPAGPQALGITKFVCKGTFALPSPAAAPSGGYVQVAMNIVPPGTSVFPSLPVFPCVGLGNPAGSMGYKCKSPLNDLVLIKANLVKGVLKSDIPAYVYGTGHPYPSGTDLAIRVISNGASDTKQYCARFGGPPAIKDTATLYKRKDALTPPAACSPSGAFLDEGDSLL